MKHLDIKVYGRVQGVFYRDTAQREARRLGINGFVRNERDGSVYIEAEGEEEAVDQFLESCRKGPSWARVEYLKMLPGKEVGFSDFEVRY